MRPFTLISHPNFFLGGMALATRLAFLRLLKNSIGGQGCQYTSPAWGGALELLGIAVSMDGRRRCKDNIWIERFWRTIK